MNQKKITIVADDKIPYLKEVLEPYARVQYLPGLEISKSDLMQADALITRSRTPVNKTLLEGTPVRFVATATIGFDHIDTLYLKKKGITWTNAPGCNSGSVMQYVGAALVWLARNKRFDFKEKTLGIIGVGNVGSKVARMAKLLGFRVLVNDPPRERREGIKKFISISTLLRESDIVTLHVPLNNEGKDQTLGMVNGPFLESMKKGVILINSSRGQVVKEKALKRALQSGQISGAILDVWNNEPDIDTELLQLTDLATPHIAGYSADGKANGTAMSVKAIANFFHLPLQNWYPNQVPPPAQPEIDIPAQTFLEQQILEYFLHHTYPIEKDDTNLRENIANFEKLRGSYPVRREFSAYTIKQSALNQKITLKLKKLGFKII